LVTVYGAEGQISRKDFGMESDLLADNRMVVSHEIKIFVEAEVGEQWVPDAAAPARSPSMATTQCRVSRAPCLTQRVRDGLP